MRRTISLVAWAVGAVMLVRADAGQGPTFRSGVQTVVLHATVRSDTGRFVASLTKDDFEVRDQGQPVPITVFSSDPQPITVALLLDMSGSMASRFLRMREATKHFIDALQPEDRVRIGTFGEEVALNPHLTGDKQVLNRILREELWPGGSTPLWEAVARGMRSLDAEPGRRVVLALTDGSASSRDGYGESLRRSADAKFVVFAVGLDGAPIDDEMIEMTDRSGGGHVVLERGADLARALSTIADELRHQYALGFSPRLLDGKVHKVDVSVKRGNMSVRARREYRAPLAK